MDYIATFFSHFGAVRYKKQCEAAGWTAKLMPIPRDLSSSCATCVRWNGELPETYSDEVEKVVRITAEGYELLYKAKDC